MRDIVITFKAPPSLLNQLNKAAAKKRTSKSAIIRAALRKYLRELEEQEQNHSHTQTIEPVFIKKIVIV